MRQLLLSGVVLWAAAGCSGSEPSEDPTRCQQTYEFGNTGCAELTGLVTDERGAAIDGAYVGVLGPAEPARPIVLVSGYMQTDSAGTYQLRAIRMAGEVPTDRPDTVTVWVRAAVPPSSELPVGTPGPMDSVLASLEIRAVGEHPVVSEVATIVVPDP